MKKHCALLALLLGLTALAGCGEKAAPETIFFGHYEQDNDESNGPEPIEWYVLAREDGKALLLAKDILEYLPYNDMYGDEDDNISLIYWQGCTLRAWLGGEFLENAFSPEEQTRVIETTVQNEVERYNFYSEGEDTQESVFLLSKDEAAQYLQRSPARKAEPSEYALAKGVRVSPSGYAKWWLRTFGDEDHAYYMADTGSVCKRGFYIYYYDLSEIRPAVSITLE